MLRFGLLVYCRMGLGVGLGGSGFNVKRIRKRTDSAQGIDFMLGISSLRSRVLGV